MDPSGLSNRPVNMTLYSNPRPPPNLTGLLFLSARAVLSSALRKPLLTQSTGLSYGPICCFRIFGLMYRIISYLFFYLNIFL